MPFLALAADYDGTLAQDGRVDGPTVAALARLRGSGRRLILVTGRELDELRDRFPRLDLCDLVVAENGALLYWPATGAEQALGERPPEAFVAALRRRGVAPISVGRVIVATREPHRAAVLDVIGEQGQRLHVVANKGAVMVLPTGVDKATGLTAALAELGLAPARVVGVGDAENDLAFLGLCGYAVAVANALPALKERADLVTAGHHGAGVAELIDLLLADDPGARSGKGIAPTPVFGPWSDPDPPSGASPMPQPPDPDPDAATGPEGGLIDPRIIHPSPDDPPVSAAPPEPTGEPEFDRRPPDDEAGQGLADPRPNLPGPDLLS